MTGVEWETPAPRLVLVRLSQPSRLNAVSSVMVQRLEEVVEDLAGRPDLGAMVLTGRGPVFSSGADLNDLVSLRTRDAYAFSRRLQRLLGRLAALPAVSIAAVEGAALGLGMELALACDLRVAAAGALWGFPEVRYGLLPAAGGTVWSRVLLGDALTAKLLLTGVALPTEVLPPGAVAEVAAPGEALDAALRWASTVSTAPAAAIAAWKRIVRERARSVEDERLEAEADAFQTLWSNPAVRERIRAFLTESHEHPLIPPGPSGTA